MHSRPALMAVLSSCTVARSVSRPCRKRLHSERGGGGEQSGLGRVRRSVGERWGVQQGGGVAEG